MLIAAAALLLNPSDMTWAQNTQIQKKSVRVIIVRFAPAGACKGVDAKSIPVSVMAPVAGNNDVRVTIAPTGQASRIRFDSANEATATVTPPVAADAPLQNILVAGVARGQTLIRAKTDTSGILRTLTAVVRPRRDWTMTIHAISEENDDVQSVPINQGEPGQTCITSGPNGAINTTAQGDDGLSGTTQIHSGPNGICNTTATGDDVQVVPVGNGKPFGLCVLRGANGFLDTHPSAGDDFVVGGELSSGSNGICQTTAKATNDLSPANAPTAAALQTYLNDIFGKQTNVFFTVTRDDRAVNYDLNYDGKLADPTTTETEINAITTKAKSGTHFNIYYVAAVEKPDAFALESRGEAWVGGDLGGSSVNVTAHETGHLLGLAQADTDVDPLALMSEAAGNPCEIRKAEWEIVNP